MPGGQGLPCTSCTSLTSPAGTALQGAIAGGVVALAILVGVAVYVAKRRRGRGGFKFSSIWNNSAAADNRLPLMT